MMKQNIKTYRIKRGLLPLLSIVIFLATGCEKEESDTTPPGKLTVTQTESLNGGAKISYTLPNNDDILFVKAEYVNTLGREVFKVSSRFTNTIEIDGFNDTLSHTIYLSVYDQHNNKSEIVDVQVTPLESFIHIVKKTIKLEPALGGVKISWENSLEQLVHVHLYYTNDEKEETRTLRSYSAEETIVIRGMDSIEYDFEVLVEDVNGNKTERVYIDRLKPLFEQKIDKSTWTLVDALSVDGNAWEGETVKFWDDVIDTKESPADNSYFIINRDDNGGSLNFPLDIVVDFNKQIILNRFVVWQRAYAYKEGDNGASEDYYYYQNENMRSFDLFASNNKQEWLLLGSFDIGDPKDEDGNILSEKIQEAIEGHEFELENTTDPFRYLKFSITSGYGSETNVYGSEITLFGLDNIE